MDICRRAELKSQAGFSVISRRRRSQKKEFEIIPEIRRHTGSINSHNFLVQQGDRYNRPQPFLDKIGVCEGVLLCPKSDDLVTDISRTILPDDFHLNVISFSHLRSPTPVSPYLAGIRHTGPMRRA